MDHLWCNDARLMEIAKDKLFASDYAGLKTMLDDGFDINMKDHNGWSLLFYAIGADANHADKMVSFLLDNRANVEQLDKWNNLPIHYAYESARTNICLQLARPFNNADIGVDGLPSQLQYELYDGLLTNKACIFLSVNGKDPSEALLKWLKGRGMKVVPFSLMKVEYDQDTQEKRGYQHRETKESGEIHIVNVIKVSDVCYYCEVVQRSGPGGLASASWSWFEMKKEYGYWFKKVKEEGAS